MRVRLKPYEAVALGLEVNHSNAIAKGNPKYEIDEEQMETIHRLRKYGNTEFKEVKRTLNKDGEIITKVEKLSPKNLIDIPLDHVIKRVSTNVSTNQQWIITEPAKAFKEVVDKIDFESIVKKYIEPVHVDFEPLQQSNYEFDRLVYTDVHNGMTTNENGYSLYGGKWDEDEIKARLAVIIAHVVERQTSNTLFIDELGDFMDGWDGETTRKGHKLPQNMDNEKAFDVGLYFKVAMIQGLAKHYTRIICHNVCNDNHAGSFGYVVNSAFKQIVEARYSHVEVTNFRKFMDHYIIGDLCFILTHGKDSKSLKFGFKPHLDPKQIEKIKNYIDQHKLHAYKVELSKGDSHQKLFDESSSDAFDYYNYGALSPSSEWVQTNFKRGKSFFEFFNYKANGQKVHNPHVFEWEVGRVDEIRDYTNG
tara:strand:+ start:365 stop:1624 length:1260 start_codon:yes stop_codon:yes gene_type:complete